MSSSWHNTLPPPSDVRCRTAGKSRIGTSATSAARLPTNPALPVDRLYKSVGLASLLVRGGREGPTPAAHIDHLPNALPTELDEVLCFPPGFKVACRTRLHVPVKRGAQIQHAELPMHVASCIQAWDVTPRCIYLAGTVFFLGRSKLSGIRQVPFRIAIG